MVETAQSMTDAEVEDLAKAMRGMALAMDARALCAKTLAGRSLSCHQAGAVLGAVQLGIAQRIIAREVLHGKIRGLPQGIEDAIAPVSAELRRDVQAALLAVAGGAGGGPAISRSITAPLRPKQSMLQPNTGESRSALVPILERVSPREAPPPARQSDWAECVERLRARVGEEEMSAALYGDLTDTFQALGLGPLPPPSARGSSAATPTSETPAPLGKAASELTSVPQAPARLPAGVPPPPAPGSLPCSSSPFQTLKISALPAPPPQRGSGADANQPKVANEGNLTVDDVADGMSEESV